jgi:hypothetical protein
MSVLRVLELAAKNREQRLAEKLAKKRPRNPKYASQHRYRDRLKARRVLDKSRRPAP